MPNTSSEPTRESYAALRGSFRGRAARLNRYATENMRIGITSGRLFLVAFFLFGVAGCYPIPKEFSMSDLVGVWILRYSFGVEQLRINPDGSYVQTFSGNNKAENTGKWSQDKTHLLLEDALMFADAFGKPLEKPEKGNVGLGTAWYFGRLVLNANPDQGFMYEKQH